MIGSLVDALITNEVIKKSGSWFSFGDVKLGQGRDGVIAILEKDSKLLKSVEDELKKVLAA
jgi:recombination protein RecA